VCQLAVSRTTYTVPCGVQDRTCHVAYNIQRACSPFKLRLSSCQASWWALPRCGSSSGPQPRCIASKHRACAGSDACTREMTTVVSQQRTATTVTNKTSHSKAELYRAYNLRAIGGTNRSRQTGPLLSAVRRYCTALHGTVSITAYALVVTGMRCGHVTVSTHRMRNGQR
jgi:hypothetical protein